MDALSGFFGNGTPWGGDSKTPSKSVESRYGSPQKPVPYSINSQTSVNRSNFSTDAHRAGAHPHGNLYFPVLACLCVHVCESLRTVLLFLQDLNCLSLSLGTICRPAPVNNR